VTLESAFVGQRNSLNALRLAMAALVIVSHSWWLGGHGPDPTIAGGKLGAWAVVVFFGVSGYLVTLSRLRSGGNIAFAYARFLRIMPGLAVCLMVVAFVMAPLVALFGRRTYSTLEATSFFLGNLSLFGTQLGNFPIGSTLADVPGADQWNTPLWTLFWEVLCYGLVGVFSTLRPKLFRVAIIIIFCVVMGALALMVVAHGPTGGPLGRILCPVATFLAGSILCLYRSRVSMGKDVAMWASAVLVLSYFSGTFLAFCPLPMAYLILWFGSSPVFHRIGSRHDISYGMYIYGWPVQQLLALAGLHTIVPLGVLAVISVLATAPLAWLSFVLVEAPAQRFGRQATARKFSRALVTA
jgi:peptidoglycan/LPS O-acetylase OafA/YrhL